MFIYGRIALIKLYTCIAVKKGRRKTMVTTYENGCFLLNGTTLVLDDNDASAKLSAEGFDGVTKEQAKENTICYGILKAHNTSDRQAYFT